MNETIKPIEGYPPYSITIDGLVLNTQSGRYKKQVFYKGYWQVNLHKNLKQKSFRIHRLKAIAFIPNPNNLPYINHKDGNKANNELSNLEWCTPGENSKHAFDFGLNRIITSENCQLKQKEKCSKLVLNTQTGIYYNSAKEAAASIGMKRSTLSKKLTFVNFNNTFLIYV